MGPRDLIKSLARITVSSAEFERDTDRYQTLLDTHPPVEGKVDGAKIAVFQLGNTELWLKDNESQQGFSEIGLGISDQERFERRLAKLGVGFRPVHGRLNQAKERREWLLLDTNNTRGLAISCIAPRNAVARQPECVDIDHAVVRSSAPDSITALLGARLGLDLRMDISNAAWDARLMFFRAGDAILEVAQKLSDVGTAVEDTLYGLSWRTPNIQRCHERIASGGFSVSPIRQGRKPGTMVFTVYDAPGAVPTLFIGQQAP